jgi:hypothetical protein
VDIVKSVLEQVLEIERRGCENAYMTSTQQRIHLHNVEEAMKKAIARLREAGFVVVERY